MITDLLLNVFFLLVLWPFALVPDWTIPNTWVGPIKDLRFELSKWDAFIATYALWQCIGVVAAAFAAFILFKIGEWCLRRIADIIP